MKQQEFMTTKLELTEKENLNQRQQQLCYLLNQTLQELGDGDPPLGLQLPELDTTSTSSATEKVSIFNMLFVASH